MTLPTTHHLQTRPASAAWTEQHKDLAYLREGPDNSDFARTLYIMVTRAVGRLFGRMAS